jgi:hypothetical protein
MKKHRIVIIIFFTLVFNICQSQKLNFDFLNQLTTVSFEKIDELMIKGYGFEKFNIDNKNTKEYIKLDAENPNSVMLIKIIKSEKFTKNALDIKIGKNYSIKKIKNNLAEKGFIYKGSKKGLTIYLKEKMLFLIANEPNEVGATQIIITYDK